MGGRLGPGRGGGLEGSCDADEWVASRGSWGGIELLRARFGGRAFERHRHATYAIGVTEVGVQEFDYRGRTERSLPGQVVVLHPDETHDGRAGAGAPFGYRILYVDPALIATATQDLTGRPSPLPFVADPVLDDAALRSAVVGAFRLPPEPLALDALVLRLAEGLIRHGARGHVQHPPGRIDHLAIERGRAFLEQRLAVVRSEELEAITGLSRYEFARQFRTRHGTSPYRYSLARRLDHARRRLHRGASLADLALDAGFADQAHLTRAFKATFGLTPGRYARLCGAPPASASWPGAGTTAAT
jgi:AraC-like DNA-binding protein